MGWSGPHSAEESAVWQANERPEAAEWERMKYLSLIAMNELSPGLSRLDSRVPAWWCRGLMTDVYRSVASNIDCTAGGITSKSTQILLVGSGVSGPTTIGDAITLFGLGYRVGVLKLYRDALRVSGNITATPLDAREPNYVGQYMAGGNFIWSCDSRFPSRQPIPVHDRAASRERS